VGSIDETTLSVYDKSAGDAAEANREKFDSKTMNVVARALPS